MRGSDGAKEKNGFLCVSLCQSPGLLNLWLFIRLLVFWYFIAFAAATAYPWRLVLKSHRLPVSSAIESRSKFREIGWNLISRDGSDACTKQFLRCRQMANVFTSISRLSPISFLASLLFQPTLMICYHRSVIIIFCFRSICRFFNSTRTFGKCVVKSSRSFYFWTWITRN